MAAATVIWGLTGDSAWRPNLRRTLEVERAQQLRGVVLVLRAAGDRATKTLPLLQT